MAEEFEVSIRDGFGNSISFTSLDAIFRFIELEEEAWAWLKEASHQNENMEAVASTGFAQFRTFAERVRNEEWDADALEAHLANLYAKDHPTLLLSNYEPGANVVSIREQYDETEGEVAYALATGRCSLDPSEDLRTGRMWAMLSAPTLIKPTAHVEEHRRKMGALRGALQKMIDQAEQEHKERIEAHEDDARSAQKRYRDVASFMVHRASRRADRIGERANEAIDKIEATDKTFTLQMGLEAPVRYWRTKHRQHQWAWKVWGLAVIIYLIVVGMAVGLSFSAIWEAVPVGQALSGRHVLLVTSIGAALTLIFWVARLLIRIFLGERHLATDAEERRVMTQAYLALMKAGGASDAERSIILASLFRGAQDGIVREEGAQDFTVPAMLAKLLDGRRAG